MATEPLPQSAFPVPAGEPPSYEDEARALSSEPLPSPMPLRWQRSLGLFLATAASMQLTAMMLYGPLESKASWALFAASQAFTLLAILLVHELGHYIAARLHRVPASLPLFLPLPVLSLFGTMGAVIVMNGRIRSRRALLDIGAAGPLAGLCIAIPALCYGLSISTVDPLGPHGAIEGQSLLYVGLKRLVLGPIPPGFDVSLHPVAMAAWGGLLLTTLNLFPWGQLDGGHIAYALVGERYNRIARWLRHALLLPVAYNLYVFMVPILLGKSAMTVGTGLANSASWLGWYIVTGIMGRVSGAAHPPFEPGELGWPRVLVGILSLALFVLLFMPTPFTQY